MTRAAVVAGLCVLAAAIAVTSIGAGRQAQAGQKQDEPINWTVEFGVKQPEATAASERVATVGSQQEVILPFPIEKERPAISADLVRKYSGRLVIAYAVVTTDGKVEQVSIKQSPDPALDEIVLSSLRKWTFRPARRNGEVISAKILLGIPVRAY